MFFVVSNGFCRCEYVWFLQVIECFFALCSERRGGEIGEVASDHEVSDPKFCDFFLRFFGHS